MMTKPPWTKALVLLALASAVVVGGLGFQAALEVRVGLLESRVSYLEGCYSASFYSPTPFPTYLRAIITPVNPCILPTQTSLILSEATRQAELALFSPTPSPSPTRLASSTPTFPPVITPVSPSPAPSWVLSTTRLSGQYIRSAPNLRGQPLSTLSRGFTIVVSGLCEEADGYVWVKLIGNGYTVLRQGSDYWLIGPSYPNGPNC